MTDVPEFSVRGRIGGRGYDATRSFLEKAVSFPENVNVEVTQTFTGGADPAAAGGGRGREGAARGMRGSSGTVLTHHSMVKLPEKPMMPRLFDERVGYFTQGLTDYGTDEHRSVAKRYIARYRLEKKDPNAEVSEPVKPIVYYVDPATPKKWVPFVIKGIQDWQVAFEAAGFKNAIIAKEAPAERSRLEPRGRAVFGDSLAAVDDGERVGSAHPRSADRRDSRSGHPVLPQRPEPREELVLHPGRTARSARETAAAARRSDGRADALRRRARGRPHARLPAQHEGELDLHDRAGPRPELGEAERAYADADGLLAVQLRRAARGQHRSGGPDSEDRPVRQVGDHVGLQADSKREDAGRGEADARQVGARAGREGVPAVLDRRQRRRRSR